MLDDPADDLPLIVMAVDDTQDSEDSKLGFWILMSGLALVAVVVLAGLLMK